MVSAYYEIQNEDKIEILPYYTLEQVLDFMDIAAEGEVLVNHVPANLQTKVYENFTVDCQITDKFHETEAVLQESMDSSDTAAIDQSHEPMSVGDMTDESQSSETVNTENITDEQQSQSFDPEKDFAITVSADYPAIESCHPANHPPFQAVYAAYG